MSWLFGVAALIEGPFAVPKFPRFPVSVPVPAQCNGKAINGLS